MTRLFFIFQIIFCFAIVVAAQTDRSTKLEWSPTYQEPNSSYIAKVIPAGGGGFYALRRKPEGTFNARPKIWVEYYDSKMKLKRSEEFDLRYKKKVRDFEDLIMLNGELYILTSFNNQAKNKNYLFKQKLSKRLVAERKLALVGEIDTRNRFREGSFDFNVPRDSSKLLIYNQLPYKNNTPEQFAFRVYDDQFNELWKKNIVLPYNDDIFSVEEYRVDEKGNVYLLGILYRDRAARTNRRRTPGYEYIILAYTENGQKSEEYRINLREKFITDFSFRIADDGNLVCSGFYSEKSNLTIKGTYFFRLNAQTKERYNENLRPFDFDFITEDYSDWGARRAERAEARGDKRNAAELYQYSIDDLILRSDGGVVLVAEQFFIERSTYRDAFNGVSETTYYYNYNDIIVVNINPKGEIEWSSRIPKRQVTQDDGGYFSSYAKAIGNDRLYFVYNDNPRNMVERKNSNRRSNFNGRNSLIVVSEIRMDGSVETYPIERNRDANVLTRPKICKQVGKNEMVIYGERGSKYRFGSLEFNRR